ncbi:hypothetical protein HHK36_020056 [Tetracentron sinense]|uniref:PGG domain-containing protein n=1 Tax=Tetracentron sinense TaxID=13715 RepID=A0A835D7P8_TETSI|nr:hypothetical protein HHK36_020056 [Tetracentron sinense]
MDQRLIHASQEGDRDALYVLLREHPYSLENVDRVPFIDTPLHIAVSAGKTSFAMEIANLKPSFAKKLNEDGYSPMHLASAMGDIAMMEELMTIGRDLCLLKGRDKRTPLHRAAMFGRIDIINELVNYFPKSIGELTVQKETALHLALKNNQLDAFQLLLDWVKELDKSYIVNWKDNEGNTGIQNLLSICDFSLMMKVFYWVRSSLAPKFLSLNFPKVDVNSKNANGHTALDILLQLPTEDRNEEIEKILRSAKAKRGTPSPLRGGNEIIRTSPTLTDHHIQVPLKITRPLRGWMGKFVRGVVKDYPMEVRNALLVVAVLTAAATFQTGVNPPGGVWQDNYSPDEKSGNNNPHDVSHTAGTAIMATYIWGLSIFTICNLSGFLISYGMIILLTQGFPMRSLLLLALHSMALTYMISLCIICPLNEKSVYFVYPVIALGIIIICLLYMGAVFIHYHIHYHRKKKAVEREQMVGASVQENEKE